MDESDIAYEKEYICKESLDKWGGRGYFSKGWELGAKAQRAKIIDLLGAMEQVAQLYLDGKDLKIEGEVHALANAIQKIQEMEQ